MFKTVSNYNVRKCQQLITFQHVHIRGRMADVHIRGFMADAHIRGFMAAKKL